MISPPICGLGQLPLQRALIIVRKLAGGAMKACGCVVRGGAAAAHFMKLGIFFSQLITCPLIAPFASNLPVWIRARNPSAGSTSS